MIKQTFIIAEAGVNHNGSLETALEMVEIAVVSGADAVKFQTFKADQMISRFAEKAAYQKRTTGSGESQLDMLRRFELNADAHIKIMACCKKNNIEFLSTPFDTVSIDLLHRLGLQKFKISSGDLTNLPYLRKVGSLKKEIILSSGMATLDEVRDALKIIEEAGTTREQITVLHCNTEYPTPMEDVNLLAMLTIKNSLGVNVGYSDHTLGIEVPVAAVALGASIIEKHFTLDRNMTGPDHQASLEPDELKAMVTGIRNIDKALGHGRKELTPSELKNINIARKSIVADHPIHAGEKFTTENLTVKRPGTGVSPMLWDEIIGKTATRNYNEDESIDA